MGAITFAQLDKELDENPDTFEVNGDVDEFGDAFVTYKVNGKGLELTAAQAQAFGTMLILAADQAERLARKVA